ncbi:MAG: hypothetical protein C0594_16545 [Marinilabiliales bacterium]|nr:MAG: hypothetical protein C0594_16545 [Marinilabiliales bacterium]
MKDIKKMMPKVRSGFYLDETTMESKNPSLKYTDKSEDNTLMFFLDEDGICKYEKFMLDIDKAKYTVDTLTKNYKYLDDLKWEHDNGRKECLIQMKNSEWFFTVFITEIKD